MSSSRVLATAIFAALVAPAAGHASTVSVERGPRLLYVADAGETNQLTLAYNADGSSITVTDPGATIAVAGCITIEAHTARCEVEREVITDLPATVSLGDGDDSVTITAPDRTGYEAARIDGGPGDDTLRGTAGDDVIAGGGGGDTIDAGAGDDTITDGDEGGLDTIAGGPGADRLSYADRTTPVVVDLTGGPDGEDAVSGIEAVVGGSGDDTLAGDDRAQGFAGGPGDDKLYGAGGDDTLAGGPGDDLVFGEDGDDILNLAGGTDSPLCGAGHDRVTEPGARAVVQADCEALRFYNNPALISAGNSITVRPTPARRMATALRFRLACPKDSVNDFGEASPCRGKLRLRSPETGKLLGVGRFGDNGFDGFAVRVRLTSRGQALLASAAASEVRAVLTGSFRIHRWTVEL